MRLERTTQCVFESDQIFVFGLLRYDTAADRFAIDEAIAIFREWPEALSNL